MSPAVTAFASFVAIAVWAGAPAPAVAQEPEKPVVLNVGDEAPEFESVDDEGKPWKSIDHVGRKILVVYFYPADTTGGCTAQACGYRDALGDLNKQGVEVVGVSGDSVESHKLFKKIEKLNFTLLSDYEGKLAKAFGVKTAPGGTVQWTSPTGEKTDLVRGITTMRWTFVIDREGHIAYKNDKVDHAKDPAEVAKVVAKLKKDA
jgi:peroxiredoxin Q/BCP